MEPENGNPFGAGQEFLEFLGEQRSVRNFEPRPVDERLLDLVVRAAATAPVWGKDHSWHLVVVNDPAVLKKVQDAATAGFHKLNFWIRSAPAILVCCARPAAAKKRDGVPLYLVDAAIALERAALMAHQVGLGTSLALKYDERAIRRTCRVPNGHRVVALLAAGHPRGEGEAFLGLPVINDFAQYYDRMLSRQERHRQPATSDVFSYNYFAV